MDHLLPNACSQGDRPRNLLLVAILTATVLFTGYNEGYLGMIDWRFGAVLLAGLGAVIWLALTTSTARLLSLVVIIFALEYIKEALGIRDRFWVYAHEGAFVFGVWAWVLAGVSCYTLATRLLTPLLRRFLPDPPHIWNAVLLLAIAGLGLVLMGHRIHQPGAMTWVLYALLLGLALLGSWQVDLAQFLAFVVVAWLISIVGETLGSHTGIWTFTGSPFWPPAFLLFGRWPVEILAQASLARLLVPAPSPAMAPAVPAASVPVAQGHHACHHRPINKEERQAATFLKISAAIYFPTGLLFIIAPDWVLSLFNRVSSVLNPHWPLTPVGGEHFWTTLAFSMMMTITAVCIGAFLNIRRNRNMMAILLVSKATSSLTGLALFLFQTRHFSYLGISLVDGAIFAVTLFVYLRASKSFFAQQTFFLHKPPAHIETTPPTTVVVRKGKDASEKFTLLEEVLDKAGFWTVLDREFKASKKSPADFRVVIKPNFMFMHSRQDRSTFTDPELVEALIDHIVKRGFPNVTVVEAQSTYGNYYENREVLKVAKYVGYTAKNYKIVDLTEEKVRFDYGGRLGWHWVGPTWRDADFRVSFAKNKTHVFCNYTLTLKNIYGTLPLQNKLKEYHTKREYDWPTIETLKHFPVHFGLIDAILSADGQFGVVADPTPLQTNTIIGGESLIAVDWVGAKKMGLDPDAPGIGRYLPLAIEAFGRPKEIIWDGDKDCYTPWTNVSELIIKPLDVIEEAYVFSNWCFGWLSAMDPYFKLKITAWPTLLMRWLLAPLKRLLYPHDQLLPRPTSVPPRDHEAAAPPQRAA